ncbi:MAG TPA: DUF721 domain-containing protein [Armatimonadota bacterium]|jgi:hypothetical protein
MTQGQASLQTLVGGLLKNPKLVSSMRRVMLMSLWPQVVGELVAQKSWPEKVEDGVLIVGVVSHAWANELHMLKAQIIARYRKLLGRSILRDVEFRVTRRKARGQQEQAGMAPMLHPAPHEKLPLQPVPKDLFAGITNPEVRDVLAPMFSRLRAERDWKQQNGWARCPACQRIFHGANCPHCHGQQGIS